MKISLSSGALFVVAAAVAALAHPQNVAAVHEAAKREAAPAPAADPAIFCPVLQYRTVTATVIKTVSVTPPPETTTFTSTSTISYTATTTSTATVTVKDSLCNLDPTTTCGRKAGSKLTGYIRNGYRSWALWPVNNLAECKARCATSQGGYCQSFSVRPAPWDSNTILCDLWNDGVNGVYDPDAKVGDMPQIKFYNMDCKV